MLRAENVTVRYGAQTVVNGLSFELRAGQWLMLVGPNGAGKSTLIEAIAQGVPYTGRISLEGRDIRALKGAEQMEHHVCERLGVQFGETTADGKITLMEAECLASCGTAPVMLVDDKLEENLTRERVDKLLEELRKD